MIVIYVDSYIEWVEIQRYLFSYGCRWKNSGDYVLKLFDSGYPRYEHDYKSLIIIIKDLILTWAHTSNRILDAEYRKISNIDMEFASDILRREKLNKLREYEKR